MSFRPSLRSHVRVVLVAVAVLAAACGGDNADDGDGAGSATASSSSSSTTASEPSESASASASAPASEPSESASPSETTTTTTVAPLISRPPDVEGKKVVAFGSNVWPVVEDLLALGIDPDAIVRNMGSQEAPAYLTDVYGEVIDGAEMFEMNLIAPSIETFVSIGGDVLAVPIEFEPFLNEELLGLFETVLFTQLDDWRASTGRIAEGAGVAPAVLDELEARYQARVTEVAAATSLDLGSLTISTFAINNDQAFPDSRQGPGMRAAIDVGLEPNALSEDVPNRQQPGVSLEQLTLLDAALVFYNVRSATELDELAANPVWQQTEAHANGTVYPGVSEWRQAGFLGTMSVLDELEAALLDFEAKGLS